EAEAANEMEVAEAGLARAIARAQQLEIRAKVSGFVLTPNVEQLVGTYTSPHHPIMRLADTRKLRLVIPLTEDQAQLVERGSSVKGRWQATGEVFRTQLETVSAQPARRTDFHLGMLTSFGGP